MERKKTVLVLMSTYNGEKYLKEQLESILAQDGVKVSLLVRDDGSADNTLPLLTEYASHYPNIMVEFGDNLGFAMSFMTLLYKAETLPVFDYYAFSDQDDIWLPDKLLSAVSMLEKAENSCAPNLYFSNATAVDESLTPLFNTCGTTPTITKATSLVRYFMLGCTMVFNRPLVNIVFENRPSKPVLMHDLWLNQTCVFLGEIIYDSTSHILYRQHRNNAAGVGNSLKQRIHRLIKSFKTYERRHFREINAKNLLSAYQSLLSDADYQLISIVADYRNSFSNRLRLLRNKEINMGSRFSDIYIKLRVLFGVL